MQGVQRRVLTIRIGSRIRHGQYPSPHKSQFGMYLIRKFLSVDTSSSTSCTRRVTSLDHESWDYTMKDDSVVITPLGQF